MNPMDHDELLPARGEEELPSVPFVLSSFESIVEPVSLRIPQTTSRIGIIAGTPHRILDHLATIKFGKYPSSTFFAYWRDGDWTNETWANVTLGLCKHRRRLTGSLIPHRAGTREYWNEWRKKNPHKIREYHQTQYARRKAELEALAEGVKNLLHIEGGVTGSPVGVDPSPAAEEPLINTDAPNEMREIPEEILSMLRRE
jgi:hypothetical protein